MKPTVGVVLDKIANHIIVAVMYSTLDDEESVAALLEEIPTDVRLMVRDRLLARLEKKA